MVNKKFGIFGGLFDPPHIGHLIIAQSVLEEFLLDRVIFVPAGNPPHKIKYSPYDTRYTMTRLAVKNNEKLGISNIEKGIKGKTYTIEVIRKLKGKIKGKLYFIIGSDQWLEITTWKTPQALFKECIIIVVPRLDHKIKKMDRFAKKILMSHMPLLDISSTQIRKKVKQNQNIQYLVPLEVHRYIKRKGLYK
jgi:nicotinate-nucleotide adenylyltransferase